MLNVQLLLTGNELMSGDIVDTNSVFIAREFKNLGIELTRKVTVGDNMQLLTEQMEQLSVDADILIINGGLGPTVDDMTAQALSETTKNALTLHPTALEQVKAWCVKRSYRLTGPNLKQALLPSGCEIVNNPIGSAPGFSITHNNCQIICTPGVPVELKAMLRDEILPNIAKQLPEELQTVTQKLKVFGIGESGLQKMVNETYPDWPEEIELGFRATMPLLEVKLTSRSHTSSILRDECYSNIKGLLGQHIVSENGNSIAATVVELLNQQGKTITTAESCTGGMIAAQLTGIAGSSNVFEAGFVTYSNRMKTKLVNVNQQTLEQFGAVSEQVVKEMAEGSLAVSDADYVVSVSGIAGPDGGTDDKPVGTVCIAWGDINQVYTKTLYFPSHRIHFQNYIANTGLDLIRRLILGHADQPRYFVERQLKPNA
ncbi:CinA family nicotinamide mononucleotide deamidase-related protein [Thalassotalea psychrophila]|uniref:CinA-like protein n=1 Tax=Thalassotalea psychrophila TaxID=3065647 RepID=A0ABY9TXB1_9GAMM|nr:CinA family nicotinamide mononucleotide deamidase-related protein [Colwelliaceae bacterium SQ149]